MRFVLFIDLGNAAMQTPRDVVKALRNVADRLSKIESFGPIGPEGTIMDVNGNTVGDWKVKGPHDDNDD